MSWPITFKKVDNPVILYDNLAAELGPILTATSEDGANFASNMFDYRFDTGWIGDTGTEDVVIDFGSDVTIDSFGVWAPQLAPAQGVLFLDSSINGLAWTNVASAEPFNKEAILKTFDAITRQYWRIRIEADSPALINQVFIGEKFSLQRGIRIGFASPTLARNNIIKSFRSRTGIPLGRKKFGDVQATSMDVNPISEDWARNTWLPFICHAEVKPWFFQWNPTDYPDEVGIADMDTASQAIKFETNVWMQTSISFRLIGASKEDREDLFPPPIPVPTSADFVLSFPDDGIIGDDSYFMTAYKYGYTVHHVDSFGIIDGSFSRDLI